MSPTRILILLTLALAACSKAPTEPAAEPATTAESQPAAEDTGPIPGVDYHSHASTEHFVTRHLALDLAVSGQFRDHPRLGRLKNQSIGYQRIDTHQGGRHFD